MADIALAAAPIATPLTNWLTTVEPHPVTAPFRGVITPVELDARPAEVAALLEGAAVHDLGWLRRIQVKGEDRFRWLSGMVTNSVNEIGATAGVWNLVLNAQGRIQGDMTVWRNGENLELEVTADQADRLLAHLDKFIIMDDVEVTPRQDETALGLAGPDAGKVMARLGLPSLAEAMTHTRADFNGMSLRIRRGYGTLAEHYVLWTQTATVSKLWKYLITGGAVPVGSAAVEALRIAEGIPQYGIDMVERDLPQETSQMRALHFSKGCYLGQEIVERIRSRGNVHRHLRQLELDGPLAPSGTELTLDGAVAGSITSAAELPLSTGLRRVGLGMIRGEAEVGGKHLNYTTADGAGTVRVLDGPPQI